MTERVLRAELSTVYSDPYVGPPSLMAYVPEAHASRRCERALRGGTTQPVDMRAVWCADCTTDNPDEATLRRRPDGTWTKAT